MFTVSNTNGVFTDIELELMNVELMETIIQNDVNIDDDTLVKFYMERIIDRTVKSGEETI